jgi:hypothetical protein
LAMGLPQSNAMMMVTWHSDHIQVDVSCCSSTCFVIAPQSQMNDWMNGSGVLEQLKSSQHPNDWRCLTKTSIVGQSCWNLQLRLLLELLATRLLSTTMRVQSSSSPACCSCSICITPISSSLFGMCC